MKTDPPKAPTSGAAPLSGKDVWKRIKDVLDAELPRLAPDDPLLAGLSRLDEVATVAAAGDASD